MAKQTDVNRYIAENISAVKGKTAFEVMAELPFKASISTVRLALMYNHIKPPRPKQSFFHLFNWNLTNKDLAEAWGNSAVQIGTYRWQHKKREAKWDGRGHDTPERRRARQRELAKAAFYKTREG